MSTAIPLLLIVREMLQLARTRREAKVMLSEGHLKVDGKTRRNDDFAVGLMDVIEVPALEKAYRVLPTPHRVLRLHAITGDETGFKLCKVTNKVSVTGGHTQLNLHDGRNILLPASDAVEDAVTTRDVLKIAIPTNEILDRIKFEKGILAIVCSGKHLGRWGEIVSASTGKGLHTPTVTLRDNEGQLFETIIDYVFPVGKGEPWVSLV
jgi:small subunit ribosomal protein S4e